MAAANANAVANLDSTLALYSKGTRVWVPDDLDGWLGATVASMQRTGDSIAVTVVTERGKEVTVSTTVAKVTATKDNYELPPLRNPPMLEGIEDLTNLSYLHEPAVLHNIRTRYSQHNIYTYSGIVLIAMNPFQRVQLYTPDVVRAYSGKRRGELEPHLFAVAEDAFRGMIRDKRNQSIIVSGESGAGKTVSAKYIMRYFATADASDSGASQIELTSDEMMSPSMGGVDQGMSEVETQVLATNPIMESFGNAKTTRNDNSSRFGKYIELLFDTKYKIIGARVRTYLLERSRVVYQPETERNYHIFYQLVAGAPAAEKKELGLTQPHSYFHYLNQGGGSGTVPGVDDVQEFEITQRALSTIGVSVSVQWKIFRLLAAILHLGNMQIQNLRSDEAYIPDDEPSLVQASKLLSVPPAEFKKWIVKKQINTRFEKIVSAVNATQANTIRDSVAKFLYAGLFEWLVDKTNESLCPSSVAESYSRFIGVLDIYGFEHFRKNSFEQFCINYANEKLQQEFTQHVFKLEQDEYVKEQIQWSFIDFNDNQPCIELIEGKLGILAILDEESRLPSGADKTLVEKLYTNFDKKHKFFSKPRFSNNSFIVHHFAHNVEYDAEGFLDKNKDTVPDELLAVFKASGFDFLTDVIDAHKVNKPAAGAPGAVVTSASTSPGVAANRNKTVKQTLGSVFKQSLVQLMETINSTNVSYIRCIKSNSEKKPFHFEPQMVLSQLRACGVLETIRISTAGYPGRWSFDEFVERYYLLLHSSQWGGFKDIRGLCSKLLTAKIPDQDKYQIGLTKIFFRAGQLAYLEKLRSERLNACVVMVQKNMRCWLARKKYLRLRKATILVQSRIRGYLARKKTLEIRHTVAATKIQAIWRRWVAARRYKKTREGIIKIQCAWRGYVARNALLALRKERAALKIQSVYRGYVARKAYRQARRRVILAQSCIRRYLAKKELKQLKLEARSVNHFKEISYRLENKVVELTQTLDTKEKMVKSLNDTVKALEAQVRTWKEKYDVVLGAQQKLQDQLNETGGATREIETLTGTNKGLTSQLNAANDVIKSKDAEIGGLNEQIAKLKEDLARKQKELSTAASAVAAAPSGATPSPLSVQTSGLSGLAAVAAAAAAAAGVTLPASAMPQTTPAQAPQPVPYSPRPAKQLTQQEMLIMESTQINALRQEIATLKTQLASEKQRRETLVQQDEHNRRPSVDTMTTDMVWRQVTPIGPEAAGSSSSGYSGAAVAPSAITFAAAAHAGNGPSPAVKAMRKLRRFSSHEIWNDEMRQMLHVDENSLMHGSMSVLGRAGAGHGGPGSTSESVNGAHASGRASPPRTVEEALMEQEHTFSLLQDPKLESEIVDGLVRNLVIPKHATQDSSRRQIVFPAHVIGLFAIKLWQHGMNSNMQTFFKAVAQAIDDRCTYSNYDDEVVCFWLSNLAELESILKSASASASAAGAAAAAQRRTSIYMEGERILSKTRAEMEKLFMDLYVQWHRIVKKRLTKFIIPCVIENQSLPGFVSKDSASLFKKFVSTQQSYTIENLLDAVSGVWRVMKYYYLDDGMIRVTMSELFKMIGVTAFNHLIMRKNFATWKRGMQIQYNVSRLTEWCSQHSLPEAALHLERLMQAAKLLQLNKATPANIELYIEDLFDVCFLLSPTQISKLMSIYTVADFENPISPDILRAVASRSVSSDKQDLLLLEATSDTDTTWFVRPEPRKLLGVEKYLPQELELEMPRTILLFKFA